MSNGGNVGPIYGETAGNAPARAEQSRLEQIRTEGCSGTSADSTVGLDGRTDGVRTGSQDPEGEGYGTAVPGPAGALFEALTQWGIRTMRRARRELAERLASEGCTPRDVDVIAEHFTATNLGNHKVGAAAAAGVLAEPNVWREVVEDVERSERAARERRARARAPEPNAEAGEENRRRLQAVPDAAELYRIGWAWCRRIGDRAPWSMIAGELRCTEATAIELAIRGGQQRDGLTREQVDEQLERVANPLHAPRVERLSSVNDAIRDSNRERNAEAARQWKVV